jgi:hypothetical protein
MKALFICISFRSLRTITVAAVSTLLTTAMLTAWCMHGIVCALQVEAKSAAIARVAELETTLEGVTYTPLQCTLIYIHIHLLRVYFV